MSEKIETTFPQNDNDTIASIPSLSLTPRSSRSSLTISSEDANELTQNTIVNTVSNSSDVYITNTSKNIYNAPVVINNIYQQCNDVEQLPAKIPTEPRKSFSKRFLSIFRVQQQCYPKYYIAIPILLMAMILLIIALIVWLFEPKKSQYPHFNATSNVTSNHSDLRVVSRREWDARKRRNTAVPVTTQPPPLVIIGHTHSALCYILKQCIKLMQQLQNFHMDDRGWDDIGYNFVVGGDGLVYESRGWNVVGAHTLSYNNKSIGIVVMGTFDTEEPTRMQLRTTQKLIEYGVANGYISSDYQLLANRQCSIGTKNPGDSFYKIMKTWNHWSSICPKLSV